MAIRSSSLNGARVVPVGGPAGLRGQSAYEAWLGAGNTGTIADFLAALVGSGGTGAGQKGDPGASAYQVWLAAGNVGSVADFLASLKGESFVGEGDGVITGIAAVVTSGHRVLYPLPSGSGLTVASASDVTQAGRVVGVSLNAALANKPITYVNGGPVDEPSWTFQPGPVWLGEQGQLVQVQPASGFSQVIGTAVSPTRVIVALQIPIILA